MEASSCVKAVVVSGNQYRNNPSDMHLVQLQRQLDVLISITAKGSCITYFDPTQLLPTECLAVLVDVLNDTDKATLTLKCMMLLSNLANEDQLRSVLHHSFNLTQCLAKFLKVGVAVASDPVTLQALKLMLKITYNTRLSFQESYIDDLLKFLVKNIQGKELEVTEPCLGLLANFCRHSLSMQAHIKNLENVKILFKSLVRYLSHSNQTIIVSSLSILASLGLNEDIGEKIFSGQNINQTFQLMFNILINGSTFLSRKYVVDIFIDLMKHRKIQKLLCGFDHLEPCMKQVLGLIGTTITEAAVKIFELLLCLCSVNNLRGLICRCLLDWSAAGGGHLSVTGGGHSPPFLAIIKWAYHSPTTHDKAPLYALQFLTEVIEEALDCDRANHVMEYCDQLLPVVTETLMSPLDRDKYAFANSCRKIVQADKLLQILCSDDILRTRAAQAIDTKQCCQIIEYQLENSTLGLTTEPADDPHQANAMGAEVVLHTLNLMQKVRRFVINMEGQFVKYLQDTRLVPFMAYGMTSSSREVVQLTLQLIMTATPLPEFPAVLLGDSIAANNVSSAKSQSENPDPMEYSPPPAKRPMWALSSDSNKENIGSSSSSLDMYKTSNVNMTCDLDSSVQNLIEKMQTGLELKDLRASEIINVYEHQLQSLQTKENHLQDLLEAKALALSQADRLIAQFRCRKAQWEAEAGKLRSLVRESEKRSEDCQESLNDLNLERERMNIEIDSLATENHRLEQVADEHRDLTQAFNEQLQRLENTSRSLSTLKQEHQTMSEMHEMLRRHNETLKQQHDVASTQLVELEEERKSLSRQLKEKDSKLQETSRSLKKTEEHLKKMSRERDDLENAIDNLRETLETTEQSKKKLQHQVSSLELVCRQHEEAIQQKDSALSAQKVELEKHAQIAALIHNLSSGTNPNNPGQKP